jgi:hypothetical protein
MGVSVTVLKVEVAGTEAVFAPSVEEETGLLSTHKRGLSHNHSPPMITIVSSSPMIRPLIICTASLLSGMLLLLSCFIFMSLSFYGFTIG